MENIKIVALDNKCPNYGCTFLFKYSYTSEDKVFEQVRCTTCAYKEEPKTIGLLT
jgi:hypothetical protein